MTVVGEAGVGKSSLVRRFANATDAAVRTGHCLAYGQGITYWPLGEVIRAELGVDEDEPVADLVEQLGDHSAAAATLGVDILSGMHPAAARERVHGAWIGWVSAVAARHPLAIVVEDLHWAADDLLDLLERTAREATGPLLLIATARPELPARRPDFASRAGGDAILRLQPCGPTRRSSSHGNCSADRPARHRGIRGDARRGQSVLHRGDRRGSPRARCARAGAEGWRVNTLTAGIGVARHHLRRAREQDRPAASAGEADAARCRGDRAGLLGGRTRCAGGRRRSLARRAPPAGVHPACAGIARQ